MKKHFSDIHKARQYVRRLLKADALPPGGLEVRLAGGRYELDAPLTFGSEDSGTTDSPIVWRAADGADVVLSGGKRLTDFSKVRDSAVLARLNEDAWDHVVQVELHAAGVDDFGDPVRGRERKFGQIKAGNSPELFIDGEPMPLAQWPNEGWATVADLLWRDPFDVRGTPGDRFGAIVYDGDRPDRWADEPDAWLHGYWFWDWSDGYQRVSAIDAENKVIEMAPPYHHYGYRPGMRYRAVNLLCELDAPGEWYIDRDHGMLYLWPPKPLDQAAVVLSVQPCLLTFEGASHIRWEGFQFEAARQAPITISGGEGVYIEHCELRNAGGYAVVVDGGRRHQVRGCHIHNTGKGGVYMAGGDCESLTPGDHLAADNHIHHFSRIDRTYTPAIKLGGVGQIARSNHIHHAPHNGIQVVGNDHLIENNELHHLCLETGDVGAFYACPRDWTQRGTVVRGNVFHHISGPGQCGAMGVYLDDMTSGFTVTDNLFYKTSNALHLGGGRDNVFDRNILIDCERALHVDARATNWAANHVNGPLSSGQKTLPEKYREAPLDSPAWRERYPELQGLLDDEPAKPKGNRIRDNWIFGENWDNIRDEVWPLLDWGVNHIESGWRTEFTCAFDDDNALDAWHVDGEARIDRGALCNAGPLSMITKQTWQLPLRVSYEATSDDPCDFSMFLGESCQKGMLLQFGGRDNRVSRVVLTGEELLRTDAAIEPGRRQNVCWQINADSVTLTVDGVERLHLPQPHNPFAHDAAPVGLMLHNPARLRKVEIEVYAPLIFAKARLPELTGKPTPFARMQTSV